MTHKQVATIVRNAESRGLDGLDFARHILDSGVTVEEYQRYARWVTAKWLAWCVTAAVVVWLITDVFLGRAGDR